MKNSNWLGIWRNIQKGAYGFCAQVHIFENSHFRFIKHIESSDCTLAAIKFRKKGPSTYKPLQI